MAERRAAFVVGGAAALPAVVLILVGMAAGRGTALAGVAALAPGVALAAPRLVSRSSQVPEARARWLVTAGLLAGMATVAPPAVLAAMAAFLLVLALCAPRLPHHPFWTAAVVAVLCAVFTLAVHPTGPWSGAAVAVGVQCGLGVVVALAAVSPTYPAPLPEPDNDARRLLAPALCVGACAAGFADLPGGGFASAAVVVGYSLWAARDLAEGTLAGAAAGLAAGAALGPGIPAVGAAALGGAAAGFFRRRSAWVWPLAGIAGNLVAAVLAADPAWGWTAGAVVGAAAAALARPRSDLSDVGEEGEAAGVVSTPLRIRVPTSLVEHLRASAEACMALGRELAVEPLTPTSAPGEAEAGLRIAEQVCPGCPALNACWERKLPRARRMMGELWQTAQAGAVTWQNVGGPETIHCLRPREMAEAANRLAALGRQRDEFLRLLAQSRRSVLSPLIGIGRHLADLAEQAATAEPPLAPAPVRDARSPLTERWRASAPPGALGFEAAVAALSRPGRAVNGDSVRCRPLRGDRVAIVLSDGMGSGEPAAVISAGAAEHVLACLAMGRSPLDALRQTNEQMVADGGAERFATLDLAVLHLRGGLLEWYKMGAAPGLLVQTRGVRELAGGGLPAGILPVPEIRSGRMRLRPGDTFALLSDGVMDRPAGLAAGPPRSGRTRWATDWLGQNSNRTSALGVARGLLELARQRVANGEHDDLTVLVCRIQEASAAGGEHDAGQSAAGVDSAGGP